MVISKIKDEGVLSAVKAVIFANGILGNPPDIIEVVQSAELLIAADGGSSHCERLGIIPDILIGDLDSITKSLLKQYKQQNVTILSYPKDKDATDLELALDIACDKGASSITIYGVLGGRWDMSFGNILVAANSKFRDKTVELVDGSCTMQILHPGNHTLTNLEIGQRVSLLPLSGDATGVTLQGFTYPLSEATLPFGTSQGLSNVVELESVKITLASGILLYVKLHAKSSS